MLDTEKVTLVSKACAFLNKAQHEAWKAFCQLSDDPLHRQPEILTLSEDLHSLRLIRDILQQDPASMNEVLGELDALRDGVFSDITAIIHQLNITAANENGGIDTATRSHVKHDVENALILASRQLHKVFEAFGIKPLEQIE
jgi:hypothetical protein